MVRLFHVAITVCSWWHVDWCSTWSHLNNCVYINVESMLYVSFFTAIIWRIFGVLDVFDGHVVSTHLKHNHCVVSLMQDTGLTPSPKGAGAGAIDETPKEKTQCKLVCFRDVHVYSVYSDAFFVLFCRRPCALPRSWGRPQQSIMNPGIPYTVRFVKTIYCTVLENGFMLSAQGCWPLISSY